MKMGLQKTKKGMFTCEKIFFFPPVPKDVVNKILGYCNKEDIVNLKLASPSFRLNDILFEECYQGTTI